MGSMVRMPYGIIVTVAIEDVASADLRSDDPAIGCPVTRVLMTARPFSAWAVDSAVIVEEDHGVVVMYEPDEDFREAIERRHVAGLPMLPGTYRAYGLDEARVIRDREVALC